MLKIGLSKVFSYVSRSSDYIVVVFILAGIITFNKVFAYIGIENIFITEFLSVLCLLSVFFKLIVTEKSEVIGRDQVYLFLRQFWPLVIISLFAITRLFFDVNYGLQAIRHSLIFFYTVLFFMLFILVIKREKQFFFIVIYIVITGSTIFNGLKIIFYKINHYSFNYFEPERVFHIETDTICASLAILGLVVYHKFFIAKSRIGFWLLLVLNFTILFLTVKRSAAFAIVPSLVIYLFLKRKNIKRKVILLVASVSFVIIAATLLVWNVVNHNSFSHYSSYIEHKLSLRERNTNWRLEAWKTAGHKFTQAPLLGIGYGPEIIELPVEGVDTNDPHNSFLSFLVRHGIFIFLLYILFIVLTYQRIFYELKISEPESIYFNHVVFVCLGLTAMIIFAFFNVVLENQYEGIFFNFFLSGIYILRLQKKRPVLSNNSILNRSFSYGLIVVSLGFFLYAISPVNSIQKVPIYIAKTNHSLPTLKNNLFGKLKLTSQKDIGIITNLDNNPDNGYSELYWTFPPRAYKLNFHDYILNFESNKSMNDFMFTFIYEDRTKILLTGKSNGLSTQVNLDTLSCNRPHSGNIEYLTIVYPSFKNISNLIIKNIFISRKEEYVR